MSEKHVYFVRHGESNANAAGIDLGETSVLTEDGLRQACRVGDRIRSRARIEAVLSSPYPRAAQTAGEIARCLGAPLEEEPLFVQRRRPSCVLGKGHREVEVRQVMERVFQGYMLPGHRHSDEENLDDLRRRATRALELLAARRETTLCVVTHGMFLRAILCAVMAGPEFPGVLFQRAIDCLEPANAGVTYIRREAAQQLRMTDSGYLWRIISWNEPVDL